MRRPNAFTLIELLVVVAVVGILSSLLLPSLARSKSQAQGAGCQNNTRQLALACLMYCDDNSGRFPYNLAANNVYTNANWAEGLLNWDTNADNTNTQYLTGAALGPYAAQSADIFRCPADTVVSGIQRGAGWSGRVRSYSMNASIGDAGDITASGVNTNNPSYVQFFKYPAVPRPVQIFLFLDEHPDTIYDGYFVNQAYAREWQRLPASYHDLSANLSFADGHAELHRWQNSWTTPPSVPDGASDVVQTPLPSNQQTDFKWLISRMSVKSN